MEAKKLTLIDAQDLKKAGFNDAQINKIFGPIGIKLGGRSAPEIALSIIAQLVSEVYIKIMISAILLAAGQSKRMNGENKLTKELQDIPLIKLSVKNILASSINELIIVLGHQKEIIEKLIDKSEKIKFVFNKDFESGMASSIKTGIDNLSEKTEAFFICLGDMPMG